MLPSLRHAYPASKRDGREGHQLITTSIGQLAREAAVRGGQRPFVTFYDDATGERSELGHATFDNWVSKTANLLSGELGLDPGSTLAVRLGTHWTTLVVLVAAWRCGALVRRDGAPGADAVVAGEADVEAGSGGQVADPERTVVVGAGFGGRLLGDGGGALDFGQEVLACDDEFDDPPSGRDVPALAEARDGSRAERAVLTHGDLLDLAGSVVEGLGLGPGRRLLLGYPLDTVEAVAVVLAALAADSSIVLVARPDPGTDRQRAATERCDLAVVPAGAAGAAGAAAEGPDMTTRTLALERDPAGAVTGIRALP